MASIAYYISGHGFGHAVRAAEIIRALKRRRPSLAVHLRTTAPSWLFPPVESCEALELDSGVVQPDALRIDADATLARAADLARASESIVRSEAKCLERLGVGLVVSDIPPPAFLAAKSASLPSVAVANFSWDWIYEPYVRDRPAFRWLIDWLRAAYGQADLLLRLPFYGDLSAFHTVEDVPLVCRAPSESRGAMRRRLGLRANKRAVLLTFGGLGLAGLDAARLGHLSDYTFIATDTELAPSSALPTNVRLVPARQENFADLLAACDAVVSKPGFGIVAACLAQRVPLLYTDRGDFLEYPVLVEGIHRFGCGRFIPQFDLLGGDLGPHLDALLRNANHWSPIATDGAAVIAERLIGLADG